MSVSGSSYPYRSALKWAVNFLMVPLLVTCLSCSGVGKGSSANPPPSTIASVSVSCNPTSVETGRMSQCTATVSGTGNYSPAVAWTASAGTVSSSGVFTAPNTGGSVTITATSTQDSTKSGSSMLKAELGKIQASSISITDGGQGEIVYGQFVMNLAEMNPEMAGPSKVYIFRNLPFGNEEAQSLGVSIGAAYLWRDHKFNYIRDVDLTLKDRALCAQFGVSSSNTWHRTFWTAPK